MLHVKSKLSQRGTHILEFSIAVPIILVFLIGAFDINTALQSYTALQQGVRKTLRCAYPTDGECVEQSADTRERLFRAVKYSPDFQYFVGAFNYSGEAGWFEFPAYRYTSAEATVADSVEYQIRPARYRAVINPNRPPQLEGEADIVMQTYTVPYISGDPLDPSYGTSSTRGNHNNYPSQGSWEVPIHRVSGITSTVYPGESGLVIGESPAVVIPDPFQAADGGRMPCFKADNIDREAATEKNPRLTSSARCDAGRARILLHISGEDSGVDGKGKVLINLLVQNRNGGFDFDRPLGGRIIESGGINDDFTARGLTKRCESCPFERVSADFVAANLNEAVDHAELTVPFGKPFKIQFLLQSDNGKPIGWTGKTLKVFSGVYEKRTVHLACLNGTVSGSECRVSTPAGIIPARNVREAPLEAAAQNAVLPCGTDHSNYAAALKALGVKNPSDYILEKTDDVSCTPVTRTASCPQNFGSSNLEADCLRLCPVNAEGGTIVSAACITEKKSLSTDFVFKATSCESLTPSRDHLPAELRRYENLELGAPQAAGRHPIYTGDANPEDLKSSPTYACSEAQITKEVFNNESPKLKSGSIFKSIRPDLGCEWEEQLRQAAIKEGGLQPGAYFKARAVKKGEMPLNKEPANSCIGFRKNIKEEGRRTDLGIVPERDVATLCPAEAKEICKISFVGYSSGGSEAETEINFEKAAEFYGRNEILSSFPQAVFKSVFNSECRESYCSEIKLIEDPADDSFLVATARMKVPLVLTKLFGRDSVELKYSGSHRLEKTHSR